MASVSPPRSCLPASEMVVAKSWTPDARESLPVRPSPLSESVRLLNSLASWVPSESRGLAISPVSASDLSSAFRFSNWKFKTTTPAMITSPMATSRTVWVTMEQVWQRVLNWIFSISECSSGAISISTSSSCPCVPITGSAALASIGASCDIEATGSTGLSYAGFFKLITVQEVKACLAAALSSSRRDGWMKKRTLSCAALCFYSRRRRHRRRRPDQ
mmetsp:Transcript_8589/g.25868  ORF Transcript_8589/g.25868 Transcript_8589/m.25868 type:complete len:217 (+) Transcript_8589:132-782(+)